jgi:hypothetical protein
MRAYVFASPAARRRTYLTGNANNSHTMAMVIAAPIEWRRNAWNLSSDTATAQLDPNSVKSRILARQLCAVRCNNNSTTMTTTTNRTFRDSRRSSVQASGNRVYCCFCLHEIPSVNRRCVKMFHCMSNTRILAQYGIVTGPIPKLAVSKRKHLTPQWPREHCKRRGDAVSASTLEFEVKDTFALLQLDDLFIEPFHAADFKSCEAITCRIVLVVSPVKTEDPICE